MFFLNHQERNLNLRVLVSYCVYTSLVRYLIGIRVLYPPPSFDKFAANFVSHRSVQKTMQQIRDKTENVILYFFTELKIYYLSYSIYKHGTIDNVDPSSLQDAHHINFVIDLAHRRGSVAQSCRASERGIRRSEVRFLMGTQNFFLFPTLVTRRKTSFSIYQIII